MKPEVHYNLSKPSFVKLGSKALIHPIDHPSPLVSNTKAVATSTVIAITGVDFETMNTRYLGVRP